MAERRYLARKLLASGERFRIYRDELDWPGDRKVYREWAERPAICAIVPVLPDGRVLLVRQHRYGINLVLWEVPAGTVKKGEAPLACARRETEEETGWRPSRMKSLGFFVPTPAFSDEKVHLYAASGLKETRMNPDFDERITVKSFPAADVKRMLKSGVFKDAKSIIALSRHFG